MILPDHYRTQFYADASHPNATPDLLRKVHADIAQRLHADEAEIAAAIALLTANGYEVRPADFIPDDRKFPLVAMHNGEVTGGKSCSAG